MKRLLSTFRSRDRRPLHRAVSIGIAVLGCATAAAPIRAGTPAVSPAHAAAARTPAPASVERSALATSQSANERWHEQSLAALVQAHVRWLASIPPGVTPSEDVTGVHCGINQQGRVWFLGAPLGADRSCAIPADRAILLPVFATVNDYPCPDPNFKPAPGQSLEEFLLMGIAPVIDGVTLAEVTLDGRVQRVRRITTNLFPFTGAAGLTGFDPCLTGSPQVGVADGFWALLEPLSPGDHLVTTRTVSGIGTFQGAYTLRIRGRDH